MIRPLGQHRIGSLRRLGRCSALAIALSIGASATAQETQSPAHLRRENDALRERITELEAELAQANAQTLLLRQQLANARALLARPAPSRHRKRTARSRTTGSPARKRCGDG